MGYEIMSVAKERIDVLLVELGFYESREKAKAAVMAGLVLVNTERIEKVGTKISRESTITVKGAVHPYVSRGGLKLEKAIRFFDIQMVGKIMIDIGASTGGFTDCALKNGAVRVFAVDVGYNQLDWSLRNDARVEVMERVNFRYMTLEQLNGIQPNIATIDVSFISLKLILPPLLEILHAGGEVIALIKPQFEAGRDKVGKSGVVRDAHVHVLKSVLSFAHELGFRLQGLTYSPITGGEGNIEFLAYWRKPEEGASDVDYTHMDTLEQLCESTVKEASKTFRE
jgi:23S rRNA (cytidine1920-2'-O)/16S rRNA (cytidine1409-2'-O)-methyltransferase